MRQHHRPSPARNRTRHRSGLAAVAAVLVLAVGVGAGCTGDPAGPAPTTPAGGADAASPLAGCEDLTRPPAGTVSPADSPGAAPAPGTGTAPGTGAAPAPGTGTAPSPGTAPAPAPGTGTALPALSLPCFTGGEPFALTDLRGPAVVNLWASWCPPCREELPALQRYADRAAGQVHVLGVVTEDRRASAVSFAEEQGITFPALDDRDGRLLAAVDAVGLPATLFVDPTGQVRYLHQGGALDEEAVERHVTEHLGVVAP